uniref:Uncharacterized protein n=1 Tax=Anopheles dirus TaxID=7168 RepID=A0A182NPJ4_9DIPT
MQKHLKKEQKEANFCGGSGGGGSRYGPHFEAGGRDVDRDGSRGTRGAKDRQLLPRPPVARETKQPAARGYRIRIAQREGPFPPPSKEAD